MIEALPDCVLPSSHNTGTEIFARASRNEELERLNNEIDLLAVKADFYRHQVVLESRFGMMLQKSF